MVETQASDDIDSRKVLVQLSLWCLNPAVVFHRVAEEAASVILMSRTFLASDAF